MRPHPVLESLTRAEAAWRRLIRTEYPLFSDMPVEKAKADLGADPRRPWMFYTEAETEHINKQGKVHMDIYAPDVIEKKFRQVIAKVYENAYGASVHATVERLMDDNFLYLFFHELFHPLYCPDSVKDRQHMRKALLEGIRAGQPGISDDQATLKVTNASNAVFDQVIDTAFHALTSVGGSLEQRLRTVWTGHAGPALPDGVISIFDVFEVDNAAKEMTTAFYPLTRAVYGLLFTGGGALRMDLYDRFSSVVGKTLDQKEFQSVVKSAILGFARTIHKDLLQRSRIDEKEYATAVATLSENPASRAADAARLPVVNAIERLLLNKETRYLAIKGFIAPLARFISAERSEPRMHGPGQGTPGQQQPESSQDGSLELSQTIQDLADVLNPMQAVQLLQSIANGTRAGPAGVRSVRFIASDEFYKRTTPELAMRSPRYLPVRIDRGKIFTPHLLGTRHLEAHEIPHLPLEAILRFQEETGITQLFKLSDNEYRFDEYEMVEENIFDYGYETNGLDIPDNLIVHVDSSGSMGVQQFVGSGSRYDTLVHVVYSLFKTVRKAAIATKRDVNVRVVNFSNGPIISPIEGLISLYDASKSPLKDVLLGYQCGGTEYGKGTMAKAITGMTAGNTVHLWATDGDLMDADDAFPQIKSALAIPNTSFLYFDIQNNSSLGRRVQQLGAGNPRLQYFPNVQIADIEKRALNVMLQYT